MVGLTDDPSDCATRADTGDTGLTLKCWLSLVTCCELFVFSNVRGGSRGTYHLLDDALGITFLWNNTRHLNELLLDLKHNNTHELFHTSLLHALLWDDGKHFRKSSLNLEHWNINNLLHDSFSHHFLLERAGSSIISSTARCRMRSCEIDFMLSAIFSITTRTSTSTICCTMRADVVFYDMTKRRSVREKTSP